MNKTFVLTLLALCFFVFTASPYAQTRKVSAVRDVLPAAAPAPKPLQPAPDHTVLDFKIGEPYVPIERNCRDSTELSSGGYVYTCVYLSGIDEKGTGYVMIYLGSTKYLGRLKLEKPVTAIVIENRLEGIEWKSEGALDGESLMLGLEEKFGKPTEKRNSSVETNSGAEFPFVIAEWKFSDLSVYFRSIFLDIGTGIVRIETPKATEYREKEAGKKTPLKL